MSAAVGFFSYQRQPIFLVLSKCAPANTLQLLQLHFSAVAELSGLNQSIITAVLQLLACKLDMASVDWAVH